MATTREPAGAITISPLQELAHFRACQEVQRRAWGIVEDGYLIPVATMISVQHAGGLVLGAFVEESLVGFSFAYLGRVDGRWVLYSQLTGVDPAAQSGGVGRQLKDAQRLWAREQGLSAIVWTFDPLQAGNANLNLHHLGALCHTYHVNYFGSRSDALNRGGDTDRLLAEWPVVEEPRRWQDDGLPPLDLIVCDAAGKPIGVRLIPQEAGALRLVMPLHWVDAESGSGDGDSPGKRPVPPYRPPVTDWMSEPAPQPDEALRRETWQPHIRAAFLVAFEAGYVAMDFERDREAGLGYYILRRPADG